MYKILYSKTASKDIKKLKSANLADKAKELIEIIRENPYQNPPEYEKLIGNLNGKYSRRINIKHRLVYEVDETPKIIKGEEYKGTVRIIRMWTHYEK